MAGGDKTHERYSEERGGEKNVRKLAKSQGKVHELLACVNTGIARERNAGKCGEKER